MDTRGLSRLLLLPPLLLSSSSSLLLPPSSPHLLRPSTPFFSSLLLLARSPHGALGHPRAEAEAHLLSSHPSNFLDSNNPPASKFFDSDLKNDLASYIENAELLSPDTYNYYLSLPEKLANSHLNSSLEGGPTEKSRELALVGTAGYILSFLPKSAFKAITGLVPPPASLTSEPASKASKHLSGTQHLEEKPKKPRKMGGRRRDTGRVGYSGNRRDWHRMDTLEDLQTSGNAPGLEAREGVEELGFFAKLGEGIASLFGVGENQIARAGEGIGLSNIFTSLVSFWEDNFAWGTGKFSPKVMIERQSRHLEGREGELVLQEESSEPLISVAVADPEDLQGAGSEDAPELMSEYMRAPPPLEYRLL